MEDQLKNKLGDLQVKWDKEKLWERMEPQLPKRKNNRRRYLLFFLLLFATMAIGHWWFSRIEKEQMAGIEKNTEQTIAGLGDTKEKVLENKKSHASSSETALNTFSPEGNSSSSIPIEEKKTPETTKYKAKKQKTIPSQQFNKSYENKFDEDSIVDKKEDDTANVTGNNSSFREKKNGFSSIAKASPDEQNIKSQRDAAFQKIESDTEESKADQLLPFPLLKVLQAGLLTGREREEDRSLNSNIQAEQSHSPTLFFEMKAEIGKLFKTLKLTDQNDQIQQATLAYKQFEKPLISSNVAVIAGIRFKQGLSLSTGLRLDNIHEVIDWKGQMAMDTSIVDNYEKAFFQLNGNQDSTFSAGPARITSSSSRTVLHYNRLSSFSIPVSLGYQKQIGRLGLGLSLGLRLSFGSKFKGKSIRADANGLPVLEIDPAISIRKAIAWQGAITTAYTLNRKTAIHLNLGFSSQSQFEMNGLAFSYWGVNVGLGLRRYF